ncbi:methylthioribulose 1-phosphate dehydratase [Arenimonas sp. GDDSR-1]|uniref:methylthioribulose 1-phosphate dehydratase n=1 Tax=Arenimonas sp. GDDSR-1 TaxID=2950125 RepID=UPI002618C51A|nr:methylthioribulose 1-phosphate dehydratase [Arenimonas sp. GDDSR-1]
MNVPDTSAELQRLTACTSKLAAANLTPATSSNFSIRADANSCLITVSGRDKGRLGPDDFMPVDLQGKALEPGRTASAETLLHTQIYRERPEAGAVLHTHSLAQTLLSMRYERDGFITLEGYELLKAFNGIKTHETAIRIPIVANTQDMHALCTAIAPAFVESAFWGYLIAGHGLYTWGRDVEEAQRHLDAFEFLLTAEMTKLGFRA